MDLFLPRFALFSMLLLTGCALQATVVDLESEVDSLAKHQQALQQRLEGTEKVLREQTAATPRAQVDLAARVDGLVSEVQGLSGKLEEQGHQLSAVSQKLEDLSFRIQESLKRLDMLEARMGSLERLPAGEGQASEGASTDRSLLPGRSLDGKPPQGSGGITPTEAYNLAYNDYLKGNYDLAIMGFQNFLQQFPTSAQYAHALYWLGEAYYGKKDYPKAIEWFGRVTRDFPRSEKAASSQLKKGYSYLELGDSAQGKQALKKVVEQFPFTNEADLAKSRLAELK